MLERARFAVHPPVIRPDKTDSSERLGLYLAPRSRTCPQRELRGAFGCESARRKRELAIVIKPTLRQAWPREDPRPQDAFKISMFSDSCNSH